MLVDRSGVIIIPFARKDVTNTPARIRHIADSTRQEVNVRMANCLAGAFSNVCTDVESLH
jgi:hypothetical protein